MKGLGTDIIEIKRIKKTIQRLGKRFLDRIFTPEEQNYCCTFSDPVPHYAGRFAAKEAIVKALGTGFQTDITWQEIEILNDKQGKPHVYLSQRLQELFPQGQIFLSISHCKEYATAVAIFTH